MNERIKELLLKAGWDRYEALDERNQKFAELIVKECLEIVDEEGCGEGGSVRALVKIKEHFGVEE